MTNQVGDKKRYVICIKMIDAACENKAKKHLERTDTNFVDFFE